MVAIQPPSVDSSELSGSWPQVRPSFASASSSSAPVMPAWTVAVRFDRSMDRIRFIRRVSTETTIRVSPSGTSRALLTFVPPPKGIRQTPCSSARVTMAWQSASDSGQTTRSTQRSRFSYRTRETSSVVVWPWLWSSRSRSSELNCSGRRDAASAVRKASFRPAGVIRGSAVSGRTELKSMVTSSSWFTNGIR